MGGPGRGCSDDERNLRVVGGAVMALLSRVEVLFMAASTAVVAVTAVLFAVGSGHFIGDLFTAGPTA